MRRTWRVPAIGILTLILLVLLVLSRGYLGGNGPVLVLGVAIQVVLLVLVVACFSFIIGFFFRQGWEAGGRQR